MERLLIVKGPHAGQRFPLKGVAVTIGRAHYNSIQLKDAKVSDEHCSFVKLRDGHWYIKELGSEKGTFVNQGRRVQGQVRLANGDEVQIGSSVIRIELEQPHTPSGSVPVPATSPSAGPAIPEVTAADVDAYMQALMQGGFKMPPASNKQSREKATSTDSAEQAAQASLAEEPPSKTGAAEEEQQVTASSKKTAASSTLCKVTAEEKEHYKQLRIQKKKHGLTPEQARIYRKLKAKLKQAERAVLSEPERRILKRLKLKKKQHQPFTPGEEKTYQRLKRKLRQVQDAT